MINDQQMRFIQEYRACREARRAALVAGYSEKNAAAIGSKLLKRPDIRDEIARLDGIVVKKLDLTAERVLAEISRMAFYDISEFLVDRAIEGKSNLFRLSGPEELRELPEDLRRAIVGYKWDKDGNFIIQLADKSKALDQLARHLAIYNDKVEVKVTDELAERVRRARERGV